MSELKRGWWKGDRRVWTDAQGDFVRVSREEMQHVRDAFDFVDGLTEGRMLSRLMEDREDILDRGTPPEPEWLPVGVAPDREGRWESEGGRCFQVFSVNSKLWMSSMGDGVEHVRLPLDWFPRKGLRFRRIGDL